MPAVTDIGIDLGTSTVIVYARGRGILYQEPCIAAYDSDASRIVSFGTEAAGMIGRAADNIVGIRPLKDGVIADFVVVERMLRYFIRKSLGIRNILKPRVCIAVPGGVTDVERRQIQEAAYRAGAREAVIIDEPIAAALGAGLDIARPSGNLVVCIGGDVTEIAVISMGGIVMLQTLKIAGGSFTEAIRDQVRRQDNAIITHRCAEEIKLGIASVSSEEGADAVSVKGRNETSAVPVAITVTRDDVRKAVFPMIHQIVDTIRAVIEKTPPDLANDIAERGIVLTGGGAMLAGLENAVKRATGIPTVLTDIPQQAAAIGTGKYIRLASEMEKQHV
ncbi:MAG: rod shape-determining protein [Bilifractor sp.]|jgi:rod shape-determining protein MreB|nr:rod shape-determining protein [Lachnospiraceae bacterium]